MPDQGNDNKREEGAAQPKPTAEAPPVPLETAWAPGTGSGPALDPDRGTP